MMCGTKRYLEIIQAMKKEFHKERLDQPRLAMLQQQLNQLREEHPELSSEGRANNQRSQG